MGRVPAALLLALAIAALLPGSAAAATERARVSWTQPTDVDLHVWDLQGNHAFFDDPQAIPNAQLSEDVLVGPGTETFTDNSAPSTRTLVFGACFFVQSAQTMPTDVTLVITDPNGKQRTRTARLNAPGDGVVLGSSPPGAGFTPPPGWCGTESALPDPASADISLKKTVSRAAVRVGDTLTYHLEVANAGPSPATQVSVSDRLPPGAALVSTSGSCSGARTVVCDLGQIADGASAAVDLTVRATAAGTLTNNATASSATSDPDSSNNSASADTTVTQPPPRTFSDTFTAPGQIRGHSVAIGSTTASATILVRWSDPRARFDVVGIALGGRATAADGKLRPGKLKITTRRGATFVQVRVTKLRPGTLSFGVRSSKLRPGLRTRVTTTVRLS